MKLVSRLIRYLNAYTSLLLHIQLNQNTLISAKDNEKEKYPQGNKKQDVEEDQKDLVSKN